MNLMIKKELYHTLYNCLEFAFEAILVGGVEPEVEHTSSHTFRVQNCMFSIFY